MSETPAPTPPSGLPIGATLRPLLPEDEAFLLELYASTRQEELALTGWDARQQQAFLEMQFRARQTGYRGMFPNACSRIILRGEQRIGCIVVDCSPVEFRLIDIAVLPSHRGAGIGAALIQQLLAEAAQARRPVRLHVVKGSRAAGLYRRLGFQPVGESGCHDQMEWRSQAATLD